MSVSTEKTLRVMGSDEVVGTHTGGALFALGVVALLVGACLFPETWNPYFNDRLSDRLAVFMASCLMMIGGIVAVLLKPRMDRIILTRKRARQWRTIFTRLNPKADIEAIDKVVAHLRKNTQYKNITFENVSCVVENVTRFGVAINYTIFYCEVMQNYHHFHDGSQELAQTFCPKQA